MIDYTIYLIALILAIDCFVVAITLSSNFKVSKRFKYLLPIHFSFFHAGMVLLGFLLGTNLLKIIHGFDHWIAFGLLGFVGINMSIESFKKKNKKHPEKLSYIYILVLSIATSIDAVAIGIAFSMLQGNIFYESIIIGIFSMVLTILGIILGINLKKHKLHYLGFIGGLVLITLGTRILLQHIL